MLDTTVFGIRVLVNLCYMLYQDFAKKINKTTTASVCYSSFIWVSVCVCVQKEHFCTIFWKNTNGTELGLFFFK